MLAPHIHSLFYSFHPLVLQPNNPQFMFISFLCVGGVHFFKYLSFLGWGWKAKIRFLMCSLAKTPFSQMSCFLQKRLWTMKGSPWTCKGPFNPAISHSPATSLSGSNNLSKLLLSVSTSLWLHHFQLLIKS
jgi:hypothetical protein